jgi:hypothetical protein
MRSGNLNFLEPSGPLQAFNGTALPLILYIYIYIYMCVCVCMYVYIYIHICIYSSICMYACLFRTSLRFSTSHKITKITKTQTVYRAAEGPVFIMLILLNSDADLQHQYYGYAIWLSHTKHRAFWFRQLFNDVLYSVAFWKTILSKRSYEKSYENIWGALKMAQ